MKIIALILLVAGVAALVYGVVTFADFRQSVAGRVTNTARNVANDLVGRGNVGLANVEERAIGFMIGGGVATLIGGGLLFRGRRG